MQYNLGRVRKDMRNHWLTKLGIIGVLFLWVFWIFVWIVGVIASIGIPVGILWCIYHFIHNGYKW